MLFKLSRLNIFKRSFFNKSCFAPSDAMVRLTVENYGCAKGGNVTKFTWTTQSGFSLSAINYGAIISNICQPDRNGQVCDINLGFDTLDDWVSRNVAYFGAPIGRVANRISNAQFCLDGRTYFVTKNFGQHTLHGGAVGYDKVLWKSTVNGSKVIFSYQSFDGEEGYPGNVIINLIYEVLDNDKLCMEFLAVTDQPTIINMTNHCYLNLAGHDAGAQGVYDTFVSVNADQYTETGMHNIPTGKILEVRDTDYDLRVSKNLGSLIRNSKTLFDCNYCVNAYGGEPEMRFIARASHPPSGRFVEVYSDQPGVQLYTGVSLPTDKDPPIVGKGGVCYKRHGAFCLETQNFPDAINQPHFPSPILRPGQFYRHRVTYTFGADCNPQPPSAVRC